MDIARLIHDLSRPAACPFPTDRVEVRQTHISAVFIAGDVVYKIRKPVRFSFLDFSTLPQREYDCHEEVRLNRRLAPRVYLGVVPVTQQGEQCVFEGTGPVLEWAVKMRRLPEDATLQHQVLQDNVEGDLLARLGARLARFHQAARRDAHIASFGRFEAVALNLRENLRLSQHQVGLTVSGEVWRRFSALQEAALADSRPLIEARSQRGIPCETHGDLHLDHVYLFPDAAAPDDLVIIDCIEFNERFRFTDPIADMAFLAMDLKFHGRRDLAARFCEGYFATSGDDEGRQLVSLYTAYRAGVRGKVEGMLLQEQEIPETQRATAIRQARGHWLLALGELLPANQRPGLLLVGGLQGTGKSTIGKRLSESHGFELIRSDVVRKELAGLSPLDRGGTATSSQLYTPEWTTRTYAECLRRAAAALAEGRRVLVDATFSREASREEFLALADRLAVPGWLLLCEADPQVVQQRLRQRRDDASDADWTVYEATARHWEPSGPATQRRQTSIRTDADPSGVTRSLATALVAAELASPV